MITLKLKPSLANEILDPARIQYTNQFHILENLTARLISFNEHGTYNLDLASDIIKKSPLIYEIKLKEAFYSNGEKITLEDVKKTIERSVRTNSTHTSFSGLIKSVEIQNDSIVIVLLRPSKSFLYYLSLPDIGILHHSQYSKEKLMSEDFVKVSSGAFTYGIDGDVFYLKKNKFFSLAPTNYPDKIFLKSSFEGDSIGEVLNGRVTLGQFPLDDFMVHQVRLKSAQHIRFIGGASDSFTYIFFNKNSKTYKDLKLRKWLRNSIVRNFSVPDHLSWIARKSIQYFPAESNAFLNENELKGFYSAESRPEVIPSKIVIHTFTTAYKVTIEELVRRLNSVIPGVEIEIVNDIPPKEFNSRMQDGSIDLFLNIMATDFRTPDEAIGFEYFSADANLVDVTGNIKKQYELYQATDSVEEGRGNLQNISLQIIEDCQVVPLFHYATPYFYNSKVIDAEGLNHLFILSLWKIRLH